MIAPGSLDTREVDGTTILTAPMLPMDAIDLGNDVIAAIGGGAGAGAIGDQISAVAREFVGGRLTSYLTRLLVGTTIVIRGETKCELGKGRDEINRALSLRPRLLAPMVMAAVEVQIMRFFPESVLTDLRKRMPSPFGSSSPSTSGTGSSTD